MLVLARIIWGGADPHRRSLLSASEGPDVDKRLFEGGHLRLGLGFREYLRIGARSVVHLARSHFETMDICSEASLARGDAEGEVAGDMSSS